MATIALYAAKMSQMPSLIGEVRKYVKLKVFVIERDMTDDAQPIGDNAKLEDIVKMPIDIQLFDLRVSRSVGRHGAVGSFIGGIRFIKALNFRKRLNHL